MALTYLPKLKVNWVPNTSACCLHDSIRAACSSSVPCTRQPFPSAGFYSKPAPCSRCRNWRCLPSSSPCSGSRSALSEISNASKRRKNGSRVPAGVSGFAEAARSLRHRGQRRLRGSLSPTWIWCPAGCAAITSLRPEQGPVDEPTVHTRPLLDPGRGHT